MSEAMSPLAPNASPSDLEAANVPNTSRVQIVAVQVPGTLAAGIVSRHYFRRPGRISRVESFRRTAGAGDGAGGSTDVDVNLNGTSILAATKMEHENSDGASTHVVGTLDTAHAAYDSANPSIEIAAGDYLEVQVDAIEAGATAPIGLAVQVEYIIG